MSSSSLSAFTASRLVTLTGIAPPRLGLPEEAPLPRDTTVAPLETKNGHNDLSSGRDVPIDRLAVFSKGSLDFPSFAAEVAEVESELAMGRELESEDSGEVAELFRRAEAFRVVILSVTGGGVSVTVSGVASDVVAEGRGSSLVASTTGTATGGAMCERIAAASRSCTC